MDKRERFCYVTPPNRNLEILLSVGKGSKQPKYWGEKSWIKPCRVLGEAALLKPAGSARGSRGFGQWGDCPREEPTEQSWRGQSRQRLRPWDHRGGGRGVPSAVRYLRSDVRIQRCCRYETATDTALLLWNLTVFATCRPELEPLTLRKCFHLVLEGFPSIYWSVFSNSGEIMCLI